MGVQVALAGSIYFKSDPMLFDKCLSSIVNQNYDLKLINVYIGIDGDISSELQSIITSFEKKLNIKTIKSSKNIGLGRILNLILSNIENEQYIFRFDTDDICIPNRIEIQTNFLNKHQDIDVLGSALIEQHPDGARKFIEVPTKDKILKTIHKRSPLMHPTVVFKRRVLEQYENLYSEVNFNEDLATWYKLINDGFQIDNINEATVIFNIDEDFYERRSIEKAYSELAINIRGIISLKLGILKIFFPICRFIIRLMPRNISRIIYRNTMIRNYLSK